VGSPHKDFSRSLITLRQCNPYGYRANEECPSPSTTRSCQQRLMKGSRLCTSQLTDWGCRLSPAPSPLLRRLAYTADRNVNFQAARRQSISTHSSRRKRKSPTWEHISYQSVPCRYESRVLSQTNTQQVEKTRSASSRLQQTRPSTPTTASTNLSASLTRASTFYEIYITGLIEKIDKMSNASSG
jgi:hypothetical protein